MRRAVCAAALLGLMVPGVGVSEPEVRTEADSVVVGRVTPGATVVWFGVSHQRPGSWRKIVHSVAAVVDGDGDGQVVVEAAGVAAKHGVGVAVDLASGAVTSHVSSAMPRRGPLEVGLAPAGGLGQPAVALSARYASVLLVRPGVGAWQARVADGGPGDLDGDVDLEVHFDLSALSVAVTGTQPAPGQLQPGDLLVAVDQEDLRFAVVRLGEGEP